MEGDGQQPTLSSFLQSPTLSPTLTWQVQFISTKKVRVKGCNK